MFSRTPSGALGQVIHENDKADDGGKDKQDAKESCALNKNLSHSALHKRIFLYPACARAVRAGESKPRSSRWANVEAWTVFAKDVPLAWIWRDAS
jgi:hypothetical protein